MKKIAFMTLLFSTAQVYAESCLDAKKLVALDQQYETAMQKGDAKFLNQLLADDFYWVHNLAGLKENKAQLVARVQKPVEKPDERLKDRRSHDLNVRQLDNTAVVEGLSSVDKWNEDGRTFRTSRYQVMRTYVKIKNECKLLAVQSMKVWSSEE